MSDDAFFSALNSSADGPVYRRFRQSLTSALNNKLLSAGDRVPSIRVCATRLHLTQAAVRKAFDQMIAEGWLEVRHGSGTFISAVAPMLATQNQSAPTHDLGEAGTWARANASSQPSAFHTFSEKDWFGPFDQQVLKQLCSDTTDGISNADLLTFGCTPIPETLGGARFEQAVSQWLSDCSQTLSLTDPAGLPELRELVAAWLNQARGMQCCAKNIIITNSVQECRSIIARLFIDRGTSVLVEDPGFSKTWLPAYTTQIAPIAVDDSGIVMSELMAADAHIAYVMPSCQIPTGAVMSRPRREKLIEWAQRNRRMIIEEDTNCEFSYESRIVPSIHAIDETKRTIYIGSLARVFPEQLKLAFLVVPDSVRGAATRMKSIANRCTSPLVQRLYQRMFETAYIPERIRKLQRLLETHRARLLERIQVLADKRIVYSPAKGGTFQTIWLPGQIDDQAFATQCDSRQIVAISPSYYLPAGGRPGLAISFAHENHSCIDSLEEALSQLQTSGSR